MPEPLTLDEAIKMVHVYVACCWTDNLGVLHLMNKTRHDAIDAVREVASPICHSCQNRETLDADGDERGWYCGCCFDKLRVVAKVYGEKKASEARADVFDKLEAWFRDKAHGQLSREGVAAVKALREADRMERGE